MLLDLLRIGWLHAQRRLQDKERKKVHALRNSASAYVLANMDQTKYETEKSRNKTKELCMLFEERYDSVSGNKTKQNNLNAVSQKVRTQNVLSSQH